MSNSYREKIIKLIGDPRETAADLEQFKRDIAYFDNNRKRLTKEYPDMFTAIFGEKVIGHGRSLVRLIKRLAEKRYDPGRVYVERTYFSKNPPTLILQDSIA